MPIKVVGLGYGEFDNKLFSLLRLVEGFEAKIYADSAKIPQITVGIGFNIEVNTWREVILMYKFGILTSEMLENQNLNTRDSVAIYIKEFTKKQSQSMQTLINTTSKEIQNKINEYRTAGKIQKNTYQTGKNPNQNMINLQKDINTILQSNIKAYNKNPINKNQQLDTNMVFELTDNEAIEVKKNISFKMMNALRDRLQKWSANYLTTFSKTESNNPQEFIPLMSIYYQSPTRFDNLDNSNSIKDLILLQKALKDKNRFLAWFSVRYYADICRYYIHKKTATYYSRRVQEAALFSLSNKDSGNNIEYFSTSLDIFSYLNFNFKEANTNQGLRLADKYTFLSFMQDYGECKKVDEKAKQRLNEYNTYHTKGKHYYSYVTKEEFQEITNILHPYLAYINQTFAKGSISEYALSNIYVLQAIKDCEKLNIALAKRNDSKDLTPLLIICLKPNMQQENIDTYSIKQPSNTFLSIVAFEGAKLDMSKIDTKKSEIIYARLKDEKSIEAMLLQGSSQSMILESNTLAIKADSNETYIFDKAKIATQDSKISPILKVYMDKEANPNDYIEIHNFAKESIDEDNDYILGNDCKERYSGITLFLNQATPPHNTNCSNEGNFQVIVQNLNQYGLSDGDTLYLYSCENRKELSATIDDEYSATFSITLDLPKQAEVSKKTLSSHIILKTNPIKNTETIEEQKICANPNFQINKSAKLAKQYIITDARLNTKKQPIAVKEVAQQLRVKAIGYREKYLHYFVNSIVKLEAQYNLKNPPQDKIGQTKWAYILTDNKTAPTQKQLNEKQYKHFLQNNSNEAYIGEKLEFHIQKEWLDIDKPKYLYIYAYLNAPSTKTSLCITIQYPLSLRFNGKELQIVEWGEVKRDSEDSAKLDKNKIFIARSGKPLISNQDSTTQHNRDSLILNPDNTQEYFDYSKQRQKDKDIGAIPKGIYYIDISQSTDDKPSGIREYNNTWYSFSRSKEREKQWGKYNIPIYTNKDCTNTTESSTKRQGFYIHGGESYGDNGGIDLGKEDTRFFQVLESLKQEYKDISEYIKDDKGRIIIKLEVGYENGWHDPLKRMEIAIYSQGGYYKPWNASFGDTRINSDGTKRIHQGVDLFAEIGTEVYACLDSKIHDINTKKAYIVLKIDNPKQIDIFRARRRNYEPKYQYNTNPDATIKNTRAIEYHKASRGELKQATISDGGEFDKNSNVIYMRYMHLDEIFFTPNDKNVEVKAGTLIGKSGVEGIKGGTRGPHLHFEISSCVPSLGLAYRVNPAFYIDYKTPESMIQNQPTQKDKIDFAHQTKVAKSVYLPKK